MTQPALVLPRPFAAEPRHPGVRRACEYLRRHPGRRVHLDELSRAAYVSKYHLVRMFRACTGLTPGQYHLVARLAHARSLLASGVAAGRVAYEAGFADQPHLTRAFKQMYGVTPGQYAALASAAPAAPEHAPAPERAAA